MYRTRKSWRTSHALLLAFVVLLLVGLVVLIHRHGSSVHGSAAGLNTTPALPDSGAAHQRGAAGLQLAPASQPLLSPPLAATAPNGGTSVVQVTRAFPLIWPTTGPITSYMGPSHPLGIDIGLEGVPVAPILAAADGSVSFAGGDPAVSYGYYVVLDHGDGLTTLYGHLDQISVSTGQAVKQGDLLGYGGNTGHSTGKHLHFEVRSAYGRLDPLEVLPSDTEPVGTTSVDCGADALIVDAGSRVRLEFAAQLAGGSLVSASLTSLDGGAVDASAAQASLEGKSALLLATKLRVVASGEPERLLQLKIVERRGGEESQVVCRVQLRSLVAASHYYPPLPDGEIESAAPLPTSTPTLTPTPSRTPILPATATPVPPTRTPRALNTPRPAARTTPTASATPRATSGSSRSKN